MVASVWQIGSGGGGSHPPPSPPCDGGTTINYYRRFPADYANDTRHLSFNEHGAYNLLLDWAYSSERPLPKSKERIYRRLCARDDSDRAAIDTILGEFFKLSRYGYSHARVSREIKRSKELSAIHSVNGKKGIEIRIAKAKKIPSPGLASQKLEARSYKLEPEEPTSTTTRVRENHSNRGQFHFQGTRLKISPEEHEAFTKAFEGTDLAVEYLKMDSWLVSNHRNYRAFGRFANSWLSRTAIPPVKGRQDDKNDPDARTRRNLEKLGFGGEEMAGGFGGSLPVRGLLKPS